MAASSKRVNGLSIVGFLFAMNGVAFLIAGQTAIGITQMGLGVVLIVAGVSAARKTLRPEESPPTSEH